MIAKGYNTSITSYIRDVSFNVLSHISVNGASHLSNMLSADLATSLMSATPRRWLVDGGNRELHRDGDPSSEPVIKAPSSGLLYTYLIDSDDQRRAAVHKQISGKPNMVIRIFRTRAEFLEDAQSLDEGCVILFTDDKFQEASDFIHTLNTYQRFACVILAQRRDIRVAVEAMKAGAADCLLYPCDGQEISRSLDDALATVRRTTAVTTALTEARRQVDSLTARERDVLQGLVQGKSNKMIALDLTISPRTVEIYRAHLMEKLGADSLSDILKIAFTAGLH